MVKQEILFFHNLQTYHYRRWRVLCLDERFLEFYTMLEEKGRHKIILLLKSLLCINEKKLVCQRGCGGPNSGR